jgi:hypothetical protein
MVQASKIAGGERFGKVTVICEVPVCARRSENGQRREFILLCDCGKIFQAPLKAYLSGRSVSCGCHGKDARRNSTTTHGLSNTKQYRAWEHMKDRCDNPNSAYFKDYGGRGISYDPDWALFANFWRDVGGEYEDGLEIDRIHPDGNYNKENCRWVSESLQAFNQRQRSTNTSGRTGVYKSRTEGSWWAEIREMGKTKRLGTFHSFEEACDARSAAELRVYGCMKN